MSKSKTPKQTLTPKNIRRFVEDTELKGDLRGEGVRRVLTAVIKYAEAILQGTAAELEVEAFWQRLYLVFTEIEQYHRKTATDAADSLAQEPGHRALTWICGALKQVVHEHEALRVVVTDADLVRVDLRRHAACHVSVDGNQIHLAKGGIVDGRAFAILGLGGHPNPAIRGHLKTGHRAGVETLTGGRPRGRPPEWPTS